MTFLYVYTDDDSFFRVKYSEMNRILASVNNEQPIKFISFILVNNTTAYVRTDTITSIVVSTPESRELLAGLDAELDREVKKYESEHKSWD